MRIALALCQVFELSQFLTHTTDRRVSAVFETPIPDHTLYRQLAGTTIDSYDQAA